MRTQTPQFRFTAATAAAILLLGGSATRDPAAAQQGPDSGQPDSSAVDPAQPDPPTRVGRLARATGTVSYHTAGDTQWVPASANFPIASGSAFWTEPNARAELELSSSRIGLEGGTEIDIVSLDANGLRATLPQGKLMLRPRDLADGETWSIQTPRGNVAIAGPGRIAIAAGDTASPTVVSVLEGAATLSGPGLEQRLTAGQAATITGTDTLQAALGPVEPDSGPARERPPLPPPARYQPVPPPPAIASLPGGDDLGAYGIWNRSPEYGEIWSPYVEPGWVPYRHGRWAYIAPWGWTWIDDAPWGFAPFHYGRWVQLQSRWAWVPGFEPAQRWGYPVYAPALVTFVGIGIGIGVGLAAPVAWVPLGPREAYRPWFPASNRYLGTLNRGHVAPVVDGGGFRNRAAATMVPASAMAGSRSLRSFAQPIASQTLAAARPLSGPHPVQPTAATIGITQGAAQRMHLAPNVVHSQAPGPAIGPHGSAPVLATPHVAMPPGVQRPSPQFTAPAAVQRPAPQFTAPPAAPHLAPQFTAPPVAPRPAPQFTAPPAVQRPAPQFTAPSAVQRPAPQFTAPPVAPRPAPQVTAPPVAPRPAPQFTAPAPHIQAPQPQFRAPAPAAQPPPPHREKRPGER